MDKQTFCGILQSALLCFDGIQETELIENYKMGPEIVGFGIQLCFYLKSKEIKSINQVNK
jgi:hypothetical protein